MQNRPKTACQDTWLNSLHRALVMHGYRKKYNQVLDSRKSIAPGLRLTLAETWPIPFLINMFIALNMLKGSQFYFLFTATEKYAYALDSRRSS